MYSYQREREQLFTDEGQRVFLKCRDRVQHLLKMAGAVRLGEATRDIGATNTDMNLACMDRLVELGELVEITDQHVMGQHRVFVEPKR